MIDELKTLKILRELADTENPKHIIATLDEEQINDLVEYLLEYLGLKTDADLAKFTIQQKRNGVLDLLERIEVHKGFYQADDKVDEEAKLGTEFEEKAGGEQASHSRKSMGRSTSIPFLPDEHRHWLKLDEFMHMLIIKWGKRNTAKKDLENGFRELIKTPDKVITKKGRRVSDVMGEFISNRGKGHLRINPELAVELRTFPRPLRFWNKNFRAAKTKGKLTPNTIAHKLFRCQQNNAASLMTYAVTRHLLNLMAAPNQTLIENLKARDLIKIFPGCSVPLNVYCDERIVDYFLEKRITFGKTPIRVAKSWITLYDIARALRVTDSRENLAIIKEKLIEIQNLPPEHTYKGKPLRDQVAEGVKLGSIRGVRLYASPLLVEYLIANRPAKLAKTILSKADTNNKVALTHIPGKYKRSQNLAVVKIIVNFLAKQNRPPSELVYGTRTTVKKSTWYVEKQLAEKIRSLAQAVVLNPYENGIDLREAENMHAFLEKNPIEKATHALESQKTKEKVTPAAMIKMMGLTKNARKFARQVADRIIEGLNRNRDINGLKDDQFSHIFPKSGSVGKTFYLSHDLAREVIKQVRNEVHTPENRAKWAKRVTIPKTSRARE